VMDAEKRELIEENRRLLARVEELEGIVRALQEQIQVLSTAMEEARHGVRAKVVVPCSCV
jgi:hypothetical protein